MVEPAPFLKLWFQMFCEVHFELANEVSNQSFLESVSQLSHVLTASLFPNYALRVFYVQIT